MKDIFKSSNPSLDSRILRAVAKLGFYEPTLVQETAIPLALEGKDILARARTGSGKTAAFLIPTIQKILSKSCSESKIQALILVPTRELAAQVNQHIKELTIYCKEVTSINIAIDVSIQSQLSVINEKPNIIVATPARILQHLEAGNLELREDLESLIIDEADLILSYGYDKDVEKILAYLPKIYQTYLMSATLSPVRYFLIKDVEKLKKLVLRNPAILKLEETVDERDLLTQYYVKCDGGDNDKFLLTYFILKLKIHPFGSKKSIIFVNSIDRCYKLKLVLEQFGIRSCTLNSELPVKSRYHIVQEFNRGVYDFIIATDESGDLKNVEIDSEDETVEVEETEMMVIESTGGLKDGNDMAAEEKTSGKTKVKATTKKLKDKKSKKDGEYGVSRGIDFKNVAAVINFDMPLTARSYQHRVGRTARGVGNKGYALSFICPAAKHSIVSPKKKKQKLAPAPTSTIYSDQDVLDKIEKRLTASGKTISLFSFDMSPVEGFRYRCSDALRAVTSVAVREARLTEIRNEILNSEKLKAHFEDNPADMQALRHDVPLHSAKVQGHLRHVPEYLIPKKKVVISAGAATGFVPFRVTNGRQRGSKYHRKPIGSAAKRRSDPLKSFAK